MTNVTNMRLSDSFVKRRRVGLWLVIVFLQITFIPQLVRAELLTVTHIRPEGDIDARNQHFINILDLVLQKTAGEYKLVACKTKMHQGRALEQLKRGIGIDIVWTMTTKSREKDLLPIRIPLFKGLIGTRLLLINKKDENRFKQIKTSEQLKELSAGQGHDWPDTEILKYNGCKVVESASYDALFKMLQKNRIDYFPRSIEEIWAEAEQYAGKGLVVEKTIVISYPAAVYFFVNKNNHVLANRLEEGLKRAIADGSFDKLFFERFNEIIERANLSDRIQLNLENPFLTPETPLERKEFWYQY